MSNCIEIMKNLAISDGDGNGDHLRKFLQMQNNQQYNHTHQNLWDLNVLGNDMDEIKFTLLTQ